MDMKCQLDKLADAGEREYYYRPIKLFGGKVLKCAGFGAENPEHQAFYEPFFTRNGDDDKTKLPGVVISRKAGVSEEDKAKWFGDSSRRHLVPEFPNLERQRKAELESRIEQATAEIKRVDARIKKAKVIKKGEK